MSSLSATVALIALQSVILAIGQEPLWTARPSVRAGVQDGPGALVEVFDVEIGPNGEMLAGQPSIGSIAVFSKDGRYLRSIGRRGAGPGEFQVLGRMGWTGDTLWVVDFARLQLFDSSLEFVGSITFPTLKPPAGIGRVIPGPILSDGSILGIPVMAQPGRLLPVVRLSRTGEITDTLAHLTSRDAYVQIEVTGSSRRGNVLQPWIDNPLWVSTPDGRSIVIVNRPLPQRSSESTFAILRIDLDGDTVFDRSVKYAPAERTRPEVDGWYSSAAQSVSRQLNVTEGQAERAVRQAIQPPRYHLPVTKLLVGRDETIWLRREDAGGESVNWQVFDRTGNPIARVALPSGFIAHRAQRDRVWGVEKDSLDIAFLRVYDVASR